MAKTLTRKADGWGFVCGDMFLGELWDKPREAAYKADPAFRMVPMFPLLFSTRQAARNWKAENNYRLLDGVKLVRVRGLFTAVQHSRAAGSR